MSSSVEMPALGESVTEGTVTRWLKSVGDTVEVDEPLLEVSTDKVDTEIPSPVAGTLEEILVEEDETVEVGAVLARIGDGSGGGGSDSGGSAQSEDTAQDEQDDEPAEQDEEPQQDEEPAEQDEAPAEQPSSEAPVEAEQPSGDAPAASGGPAEGTEQPEQQDEPAPEQSSGGGGGTEVVMPALGESVTEGTVTRWLKAEGDAVEVDEPLLEVSTDKVDTEIPSPVAGTLQKILVAEDETVEVGAPLAVVGDGSGAAPEPEAEQAEPEAKPAEPEAKPAEPEPEPAEPEPAEPEKPQDEKPQDEEPQDEKPQDEEVPEESTQPSPQATEAQEEKASEPEPAQAPAGGQDGPRDERREASAEQPTSQSQAPAASPSGPSSGDAAGYVTPLVRKLASEHGVDLSALTGTGVGGRIRKQDVLAAAEEAKKAADPAPEPEPAAAPAASAPSASSSSGTKAPAVAAQRGTTEKMSRMRKLIATRMVESLQVSAQLTTVVEVDLSKVARLRGRAKVSFEQREGVKLSFLPFLALATVEALKAHPKVNATIEDDTIVYPAQENLGIAVDTEKGLFVPVIRDAGDLNIAGLARKIADLAARTRSNKVTPDELGGGTFTLTNTGSRGALFDTPIINQPQVAILGTGAVVKRPVVVTDVDGDETIAIRSMMYLALSYDHRLVDGADAARFLTTIKERLEEGAFDSDLNL